MNPCEHPNLVSTPRIDSCPDCGYTFYYGDAHAPDPQNRISRLIHPGDQKAHKAHKAQSCPNCGSHDVFYDGNAKGCNKCSWFRVYE